MPLQKKMPAMPDSVAPVDKPFLNDSDFRILRGDSEMDKLIQGRITLTTVTKPEKIMWHNNPYWDDASAKKDA
jgi:hypothetical protein